MSKQWKITYRLLNGALVRNQIKNYPDMGLKLDYKDDKLICVEHRFIHADKLEQNQAIEYSQKCLKLFWALLEYHRGVELPPIKIEANPVSISNHTPAKRTVSFEIALDTLTCSPIVMPDENILLSPPPRLFVWLMLAYDAFNSKDHAYAIRNYYMIWEDLKAEPERKDYPIEGKNLRLIRNFVSHAKITSKDVLDFMENNFGERINRYDPTDPIQQRFIASCEQTARNFIEDELSKKIQE